MHFSVSNIIHAMHYVQITRLWHVAVFFSPADDSHSAWPTNTIRIRQIQTAWLVMLRAIASEKEMTSRFVCTRSIECITYD